MIYLVILADRPRAWATGRTPCAPKPPTRGANHRHWWKLKTHFITRLILRALPSPTLLHPSAATTLLRPLFSSPPLPRPLLSSFSSLIVPPHASSFLLSLPATSTHHIPPLWRRLVRADRLNMRPAIPDGTNIIKVRPHAKPVKYRRALPLDPLRAPRFYPVDLSVLREARVYPPFFVLSLAVFIVHIGEL